MQEFIKDIKNEWGNLSCIPVMEFETSNGDYLVVDIVWSDSGLVFDFHEEYPVSFSGEVFKLCRGRYLYPFDEYFVGLQHYLEEINQEITEGYLLSNGLFV